jgi:hypothetical protein
MRQEDAERFLASGYDVASKIDYNILSVAALTLALILLAEGKSATRARMAVTTKLLIDRWASLKLIPLLLM